jgi:hypothetical protein
MWYRLCSVCNNVWHVVVSYDMIRRNEVLCDVVTAVCYDIVYYSLLCCVVLCYVILWHGLVSCFNQ